MPSYSFLIFLFTFGSVCILQEDFVQEDNLVLEEKLVLEENLVLEEVNSDWEQQQVEQACLLNAKLEKQAEVHMEDQICPLQDVLNNTIPDIFITQQEDAETQTERWTPLIENIRREAEEAALISIQER